jgi:hypothetical protein
MIKSLPSMISFINGPEPYRIKAQKVILAQISSEVS